MFGLLRARLLVSYLLVAGVVLTLVGLSLVFFLLRNSVAEGRIYQQLEAIASTVTAGPSGRALQIISLDSVILEKQFAGVRSNPAPTAAPGHMSIRALGAYSEMAVEDTCTPSGRPHVEFAEACVHWCGCRRILGVPSRCRLFARKRPSGRLDPYFGS